MSKIKTSDIYLTAYLLLNDQKIVRTEPIDGFTIFHFEDTEQFHKYKEIFYADQALVNPRDFASKIKDIRTMCNANRGIV